MSKRLSYDIKPLEAAGYTKPEIARMIKAHREKHGSSMGAAIEALTDQLTGVWEGRTTLRIEGNNGGDYLEISSAGNNLVLLEVGHCCVVTIRHIVPVEFITAVLARAVLEHNTIQGAITALPWAGVFTEKLAAQVKAVDRLGKIIEEIDIPSVLEMEGE